MKTSKFKEFKVGDRVKFSAQYLGDTGKGTIKKIDYEKYAFVTNDAGVRFIFPLTRLKRLVKKKKPTREPYRMFVNKYKRPDGLICIGVLAYTSFEEAESLGARKPHYIETVEFVEVLK